ncbi:MAG TPA: hypothetical protein PK694_08550, partial [Rhodospirillales bacterium]|nr:hypothetical protein [Rhodospirillales bacterium]
PPSGPYALETVLGPSLDGPGDTSDVQVRFGDAVAIEGDWMLVGVPERRGAGGQVRGAAFVFRRDAAGEWETHQFLQFGTGGDARCGAAVALSGRHAVIGCPGFSSEGLAERGRTLVYYRNDAGLYVDPVTFLGSQAGARCGHAVAAASWIAVGCIGQNTTGQSPARGEVELFVQPELPPPFNPQLWINPGRLIYDANVVPGPAPFQMGFALAIDRLDGVDRIAVGVPGTVNNSGMVRVFRRNPGDGLNWAFEYAGSLPGGPQTDARFGEAHIEARHGADIRKAGYESAADLVADVAANFTRVVVEGHSGRVFLVKPNGRDRALVVELRPAEGGAEYSVVSAGLFRKSYLEGRRVLWEGERRSPIAAGEGGPLQRGGQSSGEELTQPPAPGNAPSGAALPHEPAPGALPQDVHAAVEIGADFRRIILGARSDKTSFMHESSHVFLWLLRELGTDADAAPRIRQDWETIRDFLGAADPRDEPGGGSLR